VILARSLLLAAVVIWGWTFVATKICLEYLSPLELLAARFLVALPVLFALVRLKGVGLEFRGAGRSISIGAALFTLHFVVQVTGLESTTATNTGWIIGITPLVMAVAARLVLGERIGRRGVAGIAVATAGIVLLVTRGNPFALEWKGTAGDWLILASAHTWAFYTIAIRDAARKRDPLAVTFAVLLPSTVVVASWVALRSDWRSLPSLPGQAVVALLFLGVLGTAAGQWFWQVGVARLGAARAGTFLYLEPFATTALAVPLLGEPLGATTLAGGLLVLAGVALSQTGRTRNGRIRARGAFADSVDPDH